MSNPNFIRATPSFYTRDLKRTKLYYEEVLGFSCLSWEPDWGWSLFGRGSVEIMYSLPNDHLPFEGPSFTGSIYIYISESIDALWEELKGNTKVVYPLESFDYGMREFAIYDINGYMLQFGQSVAESKP